MIISAEKVRRQILVSGLHTFVSLLVLGGLLLAAGVLAAQTFGSSEAFMDAILVTTGFAMIAFLLAEVIPVTIMNGHRATVEEHPRFIRAVDELWGEKRFRPRLYILEMPTPNAAAFGWGFLGQSAIGITPDLLDLLDDAELKAVIAHEIGHIRMKDIGVMSVVSMLLSGTDRLATSAARNPMLTGIPGIGALVPLIGYIVRKYLLPILRSAISQEREFCADAIAAKMTGSAEPLVSALEKLHQWRDRAGMDEEVQNPLDVESPQESAESPTESRPTTLRGKIRRLVDVFSGGSTSRREEQQERERVVTPLDDLFISHPGLTVRIEALRSLYE